MINVDAIAILFECDILSGIAKEKKIMMSVKRERMDGREIFFFADY